MGLIWRVFVRFDAKNERAHAAVDDRAERRAEVHRCRAGSHRARRVVPGRPADRASGGMASGHDARRMQDSACSPLDARDDGVDNLKDVRLRLPASGAEVSDGNLLKHEHAPWLRMITSRSSCAAVVMLVISLAFSVTSALAQSEEDWPMRGRTPDGWGYSPLDLINRNNVAQLEMAWSRTVPGGQQEWGAPRVYDGIMYQFISMDTIQAIDAATGDPLWKSERVDSRHHSVLTDLGRDLAIYGTHSIDTSESSYVFALDVATGKHVPTDERDPEQDVVYVGGSILALETGTGGCSIRTDGSELKVGTYSPLTNYCMTASEDSPGIVQAISTETDTVVWESSYQEAAMGRLAATGGGLVFGGDREGRFRAFDHNTGEVIWDISLGSPITHSPIIYAAGGRQHVAIHTDSGVVYVFKTPSNAEKADSACPLSESRSIGGPWVLYHNNPRPYWFFPFVLTGVERVGEIYPEGSVIICEAVHRSTWRKRSLWLRIVSGSKRGWVDVGSYGDLEAFLER